MKKLVVGLFAVAVAALVMGQVGQIDPTPVPGIWQYETRQLSGPAVTFVSGAGVLHKVIYDFQVQVYDGEPVAENLITALAITGSNTRLATPFQELDVVFENGITVSGAGTVTVLYRQ